MRTPATRTGSTPTISVIVPVYDVEAWLPACLESLAAQTFDGWECVVVIDGSPDRSEYIAREWATRDARFTVVSVPNGGLGSARNIGLDRASGEWVFFLDSDDELPHRALESLLEAAESDGSDVVLGRGIDIYPDGTEEPYWTQEDDLHLTRAWAMTAATHPALLHDHVVWNKLYRRSFLESVPLRFTVAVHCEDLYFSAQAVVKASSISTIPEVVYRHRRHEASISADYFRHKTLSDWIAESSKALEAVRTMAPDTSFQPYLVNFITRQWRSRMVEFDRFYTPQLRATFEDFSRYLDSHLTDDSRREVPSLIYAALAFTAQGTLFSLWGEDSEVRNPLGARFESPADAAENALKAAALLDSTDAVQSTLAARLLVDHVVRPLLGAPVGDETTTTLFTQVVAIVDRLPGKAFESWREAEDHSVNADPPARELFAHVLANLEPVHAVLTSTALSPQTVTLRGTLRTTPISPAVLRVSLLLRSQSSKRVRVIPVWWTIAAQGQQIRWSVPVALAGDMLDEDWKTWVRVEREGLPVRDVILTDALLDDEAQRVRQVYSETRALRLDLLKTTVTTWRCREVPLRAAGARTQTLAPAPEGVFTFPNWHSNPYLVILQLEARARGREMTGTTDVAELVSELRDSRSRNLVHIHWTSPITEKAESEKDAERRVDVVVDALKRAVQRGRPVVWTVHNALPHDAKYPDAARRLHVELAAHASVVHVLSEETMDAVRDEYELPPSRTVTIPHSSYHGVYGSRVPKDEAVATLGAATEADNVLFFGQVRGYKGLESLIDAAPALAKGESRYHYLIAGKAAPEAASFVDALPSLEVSVTSALRFIDDDEVATWFSAADVAVLPYRDILNSGTMHLAATFGVPCVLPHLPHLSRQFQNERWVRFFDPADAGASIAEILRSRFYLEPSARSAALAFARYNTPLRMARAYADLLDKVDTDVGSA